MNQDPASYDADFTNEDDLDAFADALKYDFRGPSVESTPDLQQLHRVQTITSKSDWKPVFNRTPQGEERVRQIRRASKPNTKGVDEDSITYTLFRWPLLVWTLLWLLILSILYALVRLSIWLSETFIIVTDSKRRQLLNELESSANYEEYVARAQRLDNYLGLDDWQHQDEYKYYDWRTLRRTISQMRTLRSHHQWEDLIVVLQSCIKSNFAGIENPIMYSHCYYGTKDLINKYITEAVKALDAVADAPESELSDSDKRIFFKVLSRNFGKTAIALSGGASFCYNHLGVMKALIDNDLMPQIISGTSGGGAMASLAGTRTNEELSQLIRPEIADKIDLLSGDPFSVWFKRWWKTGARYDPIAWARTCEWWTMGSTTFKESLERTGKYLNITTVPDDIHSPTILCNEITAPACCIWSSVLASAAVPGILPPVVLMEKPKDGGTIEPFSFGNKWKDGSMRTDIPLEELNNYYDVKFSVVSQVNPHVMLWIFKNRGDIGKPIVRKRGKTFRGGFIPAYLENLIKLEIIKWLKLIREFQLLPNLLASDWSNLFLQNFGGTITLFPKIRPIDYLYILSDPSRERLAGIIENGQHVTYPTLLFIKNRLDLERAVDRGYVATKKDEHVSEEEARERWEKYDTVESNESEESFDSDEIDPKDISYLGMRADPSVAGSDIEGPEEDLEDEVHEEIGQAVENQLEDKKDI